MPRENTRPVVSTGSGFIISEDGYLLTNNHVVEDADEITVSLGDRREYSAEIIGADPRSDVALLKIEAENLPILKIGKSKSESWGVGCSYWISFPIEIFSYFRHRKCKRRKYT